MKKVLAVVIAVAFISIYAGIVSAQVPNVQIYFDALYHNTQADCQGLGVIQDLYVVGQNFNAFVSTMEFGIDFGAGFPLFWLSDVHVPGALFLGTSTTTGVTITYPGYRNGYFPFLAMQMQALWQCEDCEIDGVLQVIQVIPHQSFGTLEGIEFETFDKIPAVGMNSLICPGPISTQEATWGKVKALYK